jgi:hypothetical protein
MNQLKTGKGKTFFAGLRNFQVLESFIPGPLSLAGLLLPEKYLRCDKMLLSS